ncbi:unnamed protein product [Brassica oleracea]
MTRKSSVSTVTYKFLPHFNNSVFPQANSPEFLSCCSSYALSIVLVSVGDGPWTDMMKFNDKIPKPEFNNFQVSSHFQSSELAKETAFALAV